MCPGDILSEGDHTMKYYCAAAALAASFIGTPAISADITGPRIEGIIGYDSPKAGRFEDSLQVEGLDVNVKTDGVLYGVGIGYDFGVGNNLALGVDAELSDSSSEFSAEIGPGVVSTGFGRDLYIGGRITTAVSDNFNLYGKVGYTNARIHAGYYEGSDGFAVSDLADGIRAGFGGQFTLAGNSYVGLEYRYSNYGSHFEDAKFERHQVAATLGFRF